MRVLALLRILTLWLLVLHHDRLLLDWVLSLLLLLLRLLVRIERLGFHLVALDSRCSGLRGRGSGCHGEATFLASTGELNDGPNECCDKQDPNQSTQTSLGRHHRLATLEQNDSPLLEASLGIEQTAVVEAIADIDVHGELSPLGRSGCEGCEPHDDHEAVENNDSDDVVCFTTAANFLGHKNVDDDDPCENTSRK